MAQQNDKKISSQLNKKKWLTIGVVGVALLLIPRRSSRKDTAYSDNTADTTDKDTKNASTKAQNTQSIDKNTKTAD
ncbi:hypothetical protein [Psychrobacter urativorans]|uniref:Uncharacterized protein n=1 Tax=Psychrobacter urativorans TaxID=45610 RepID=A0A0M3V914_9GAMM|nr:hypothetical protein [Psychrobacter urativorans]ALF60153.1 hypothetical protein AOC03_08970 [Psychrobacter urativorans]